MRGFYFNLDLRHDTQVWRGVYERDLQRWLVEHTARGNVCLDVGAAEGFFSLLMAHLAGPKGVVHAFEPSERGEDILSNIGLNSERTLAPVYVHRTYIGTGRNSTVPSVCLDDFVESEKIRRVDVVKIDVDGGEECVLEGMFKTLRDFRPFLSIEVHSKVLLDSVIGTCVRSGYTYSVIDAPPHEHRPIGFNPTVYASPSK